MRSPATKCSTPASRETPCTIRCSELAWSIRAPIARSTAISSWTSGSQEAFSISDTPSARHAAISTFWVPFTVRTSNTTRPPRSLSARAST